MNVLYLVVPAEGVEREGAEDGAVLEEAAAQLAQGDGEILEHGVGLAHHVDPLQEQPWSLPAQPPAQLLHTHTPTNNHACSLHPQLQAISWVCSSHTSGKRIPYLGHVEPGVKQCSPPHWGPAAAPRVSPQKTECGWHLQHCPD